MKTKILVAEDDVDFYKEHPPDLTPMDIKMPGKNGSEAIREILEFDSKATIIAVTAYRYAEEELGVPVPRKGFRTKGLMVVEAGIWGR